jgi:hypothetical protein
MFRARTFLLNVAMVAKTGGAVRANTSKTTTIKG